MDLDTLTEMETEYWNTPALAQPRELAAINDLRSRLGLPTVDAKLRSPKPTKPPPDRVDRGAEDREVGRTLYVRYLAKKTEGDRHRDYATRLCKATEGVGMTPVRPIATMGTDGGELLCDVCGKPILLEGGRFNRVPAGEAFRRNGGEDFRSYISGGVVFEITYNGSVRVYHGHTYGSPTECSTIGHEAIEAAEKKFLRVVPDGVARKLLAYLSAEFPGKTDRDLSRMVGEILEELYGFDPGYGVNRP